MRDYSDLTWTGEDGSINHIQRAITDYTIEQLEGIEYDLRRERKLHYEGSWDDGVDENLKAATLHVTAALIGLRKYVEQCIEEDKAYAAEQRGE